jgi:radical SAM superfamily enzyme with C-terminal helix-hairpin-helix motif
LHVGDDRGAISPSSLALTRLLSSIPSSAPKVSVENLDNMAYKRIADHRTGQKGQAHRSRIFLKPVPVGAARDIP